MRAAVRPGEGVGLFVRAFPYVATCLGRVLLACVAFFALAAWAHPAHAGSMYHCQGAHGEAVFTGHPDGYAHCKAIDIPVQQALSSSAAPVRHSKPAPTGHKVLRTGDRVPAGKKAHAVVRRGAVYRIVRADGSVEYTNVRPRHAVSHRVTRLFSYIDTCVACAVHSSIDWSTVPLHLAVYGKAVRTAARTYGVRPAFLRAVIHAESAFNPNALSAKGAQGLMQLMPATASSMGVGDAFNAAQNIRGGARYLAQLLRDFHGNHKLAAAAYNAGPQAVRKYGGVPPYAETRVYVKRVSTLFHRYAKALAGVKLAGTGQSG